MWFHRCVLVLRVPEKATDKEVGLEWTFCPLFSSVPFIYFYRGSTLPTPLDCQYWKRWLIRKWDLSGGLAHSPFQYQPITEGTHRYQIWTASTGRGDRRNGKQVVVWSTFLVLKCKYRRSIALLPPHITSYYHSYTSTEGAHRYHLWMGVVWFLLLTESSTA